MFTKLTLAALTALCLSACTNADTNTVKNSIKTTSQTTLESLQMPSIKTRQSDYSFDETSSRVKDTLLEAKFTVFETIDHAAGARKAELTLSPSTLYIFGNPKGGTPLMKADPRMGIELPLKMHVYQTDGRVMLSYTDITAIAQSYGINPEMMPIPKIAGKLDMMALSITGQ